MEDLDGDGRDEILVSAGPDPDVGSPVKVCRYLDGQVSEWFTFQPCS